MLFFWGYILEYVMFFFDKGCHCSLVSEGWTVSKKNWLRFLIRFCRWDVDLMFCRWDVSHVLQIALKLGKVLGARYPLLEC